MLYDTRWDRTDEAASILLRAADILERGGWQQGQWIGPNGICIGQALRYAISQSTGHDSFGFAMFNRIVGRLEGHLGMFVVKWNDEICQSKEQAVAALR